MDVLKNIKLVIFDFDGTLFDLDVEMEVVRRKLNVPPDANIGDIIQGYIVNKDSRLDIITDAEIKSIGERRLSDDIIKVLSYLLTQHVKIGVFTRNSRRAVETVLENSHFAGQIKIVGREDVVWQKPRPDGIVQLMEQLGASKNETIVVGDTTHDIEAARSAGVHVIIVENKRLAFQPDDADYYINDINRLMDL